MSERRQRLTGESSSPSRCASYEAGRTRLWREGLGRIPSFRDVPMPHQPRPAESCARPGLWATWASKDGEDPHLTAALRLDGLGLPRQDDQRESPQFNSPGADHGAPRSGQTLVVYEAATVSRKRHASPAEKRAETLNAPQHLFDAPHRRRGRQRTLKRARLVNRPVSRALLRARRANRRVSGREPAAAPPADRALPG